MATPETRSGTTTEAAADGRGPSVTAGPTRDGYIPVLDGLRCVSVAMVIAGHALLFRSSVGLGHVIGHDASAFGVNVFFVISGYLITILLRREEDRDGSISLRGFYLRRVLRIFPALYLYLMTVALLARYGFVLHARPRDFAACLLFVRNLFGQGYETEHIWSLSLEEQFYLAWPAVLILTPRRARVAALCVGLIGFAAWRTGLVVLGLVGESQLQMRPDLRLDTILVGCGLGLVVGGPRFEAASRRLLERDAFALVVAIAALAWVAFGGLVPYQGAVRHTVLAILTAALVHWAIRNAGRSILAPLSHPAALFLGRLSYGLYLWQQLFFFGETGPLAFARRFPANLAMTFACALASYFAVERPFLRLRRYFRPGARGAGRPPVSRDRPVYRDATRS